MNAREILEELGIKEDDYMKHQWDRFIKLIEDYNEDDVDDLQCQIDRLENDVYSAEEERDDLSTAIKNAISELEIINGDAKRGDIADVIGDLKSNL